MYLAITDDACKAGGPVEAIAFVDAAIRLVREMYARAVASGDTKLRHKALLANAQLLEARGAA